MTQALTPVGIDFGAKMAGTTVIAWLEADGIHFAASTKNGDADDFVLTTLLRLQASHGELCVCFDAPLSLPGVYAGLAGCDDYFYRAGDRALRAMSPMFLGGLTARAMRLAHTLKASGIALTETYPAEHARRLALKDAGYKDSSAKQRTSNIDRVLALVRPAFAPFLPDAIAEHFFPSTLPDWHHVDSLLALLTALRLRSGVCERFGVAAEGEIVV